jgi:hypothetical protein
MTQEKLKVYHGLATKLAAQYCDGLLTLSELRFELARLELGDLGGLTDPNTGLKYP